jgi:RNA polymerase sigma-70 factor (ECF subfamily)
MNMEQSARDAMLGAIPQLRAYAVSLSRNEQQADDLVQEALLRACDNISHFEPGTNMTAWLITILRNHFYSEYRRRITQMQNIDGLHASPPVTKANQSAYSEYVELCGALGTLPPQMREALLLIAEAGLTYEEAALVCGCAVGTVKSRVHRGRARLAAILSVEYPHCFEEDRVSAAVMSHAEHARCSVL